MADTQLGMVLRHVRNLAVTGGTAEASDRELLRRFSADGEEAAFTTLMRRHGHLVWSVCRQVLGHEQDAEDAFQATFMVLAQKAASVRKGEALASFLHGTAYRIALAAKRNAATRRFHERQGNRMPREKTISEETLREGMKVLHEEVQSLPGKYRAVFVLRHLEGKSLAEIAQQLGCKEGTVSSALTRARRQLRQRLARRGIELSGALCAVGLLQDKVSAMLVQSTRKAALAYAAGTGTSPGVSAGVSALVQGTSKTMRTIQLKTALVLAMSVGAAAAGVFTHRALATRQAEAAPPAEKGQRHPAAPSPANAKDAIKVSGRVLDPDGKPVAGARLYLGHYGPKDAVTVSEKTKSDADGRFQFSFPKSQLSKAQEVWRDPWEDPWDDPLERVKLMLWPGGDRVGQIMAVASGLGCDWVRLDPKAATHELTLRLVKDVPISGRILDPEGKPVAGARVRVANVQAGGDLKETLEALRNKFHKKPDEGQAPRKSKDSSDWLVGDWKEWSGPVPGQGQAVTTREDGRFRIAGFGGERLVFFKVEGPGIATGYIRVMTRVGDAVVRPEYKGEVPGFGLPGEKHIVPAETVCYGATFRYLAAASRPIHGVVSDKKTGKPVADVEVLAYGFKEDGLPRRFSVPEVPVYARTDREGRYELLGCEKSPVYLWSFNPEDRGHYFPQSTKIKDTAGLKPLTANFEIIPGSTVVRGKVRNERTGKPIPGCRVYYFPLLPNPAINQFRGWGGGAVGHFSSRMMTGADGSFSVAALPGPGVICVCEPVSDLERKSWQRGELGKYARIPITSQEFKDFSKKHKVVLGEAAKGFGPPNSEKNIICADIGEIGPGAYFRSQSMWGNRWVLIHPSEKDEELKLDVALRPKEEGKSEGDSKKEGKPKGDPKKNKEP